MLLLLRSPRAGHCCQEARTAAVSWLMQLPPARLSPPLPAAPPPSVRCGVGMSGKRFPSSLLLPGRPRAVLLCWYQHLGGLGDGLLSAGVLSSSSTQTELCLSPLPALSPPGKAPSRSISLQCPWKHHLCLVVVVCPPQPSFPSNLPRFTSETLGKEGAPEIKIREQSEKGGGEEKSVGGAGGRKRGEFCSAVVLPCRDPGPCGVWRARGACSWPRGDTYLPRAGVNEKLRRCWQRGWSRGGLRDLKGRCCVL